MANAAAMRKQLDGNVDRNLLSGTEVWREGIEEKIPQKGSCIHFLVVITKAIYRGLF